MDIKVLVCDDDPKFRGLISDIVKKEGYHPIEAENGRQALDIFFKVDGIDLVILDVMMPVLDGWEALEELREYSDVPVIMLTALDDEHHEVSGLTKGANDYIGKPFGYKVFVARMDALLRNRKKELSETIEAGELTIEQPAHRVCVGGDDIELTRREYDLLMYLYRNNGRILTREQILNAIWGYEYDKDIRTIDTHIKTLRAKLGRCGEYIMTARGVGYMFEAKE